MHQYNISVQQVNDFPEGVFRVTVSGGDGETEHTVRVSEEYYQKLTNSNMPAEELARKSFEFLLEREPKESILKEFHLPEIQKYFPEYEEEVKKLK